MNDIGDSTQIKTSPWNPTYYNDAKYIGYMYGGKNNEQSISRTGTSGSSATYNETSTNVKMELDNWYKNFVEDKGLSNQVVDNLFCNDRQLQSEVGGEPTGPGYGNEGVETIYAPYYRADTIKISSLKCGLKNDRFTVNDTTIGNGALTYPVGLMTVDELMNAGLVRSVDNLTNYLYTGNLFWGMSPSYYQEIGVACMWGVGPTANMHGTMRVDDLSDRIGIRPVLSISSTIKVTGGGTYTNPFIAI